MQPPPTKSDPNPIQPASVSWRDGQPLSDAFGDVYFSRDAGLEETQYVFLQQNRLAERWREPALRHFCIGETGFGTGLNFLAAAALWLELAPAEARLDFISVEKYPLSSDDLRQALALWPSLGSLADALVAQYPRHFEPEPYQLSFADGRIQLTLLIGDAEQRLSELFVGQHTQRAAATCPVHAWFLDGFAPGKNPGMWTEGLFTQVARLSAAGASLATFTSAGLVRRGLQAVGFQVDKVPGYGRKREMLRAQHTGGVPAVPESRALGWHQMQPVLQTGRAAVIGAGLAGAHTARALAEAGWQVDVYEQHAAEAQEASGNRQGVLYVKLSHQRHLQARFNLAALQLAQSAYAPMWQSGLGARCGVLQLADDAVQAERLCQSLAPTQARAVDQQAASVLAGLPVSSGGIWLPEAGWLPPAAVCGQLLAHPQIRLRVNQPVQALHRTEDQWQLASMGTRSASYPLVVICCGVSAHRFAQTAPLPLKAIRGQVSLLVNHSLSRLQCAVTGEGYVTPPLDGVLSTGATFTLRNASPAIAPEDHRHNLDQLSALFQDAINTGELAGGRVGFRCTTPDYLPVAGPVPDWQQLDWVYAPLARNARTHIAELGCWQPGLMINTGLGSRGLAYAPLTARLIAALASGRPLPVTDDLVRALSPARFAIRDLIRNQ